MIRARLVSETREKKREKSWIVIFFKTLSNLHNIRSILRENGAHPTNPVEGCADANPKTMLPNDT